MKCLIQAQQTNDYKLMDLAYDAGYFDQAHFSKDFKRFTGQSPSDFLKNPKFW